MLQYILNYLRDGCCHRKVSWPVRPRRVGTAASSARQVGRQCCLDCGMYRYHTIGRGKTKWLRAVVLRPAVRQ